MKRVFNEIWVPSVSNKVSKENWRETSKKTSRENSNENWRETSRERKNNRWLAATLILLLASCGKSGGSSSPIPEPVDPGPARFSNPVVQGSDPWVAQKDGNYYYLHTLGNRISIWKTRQMSRLGVAPVTQVFTPRPGSSNSENVWAPELHFSDGKWYIYFTAGSGPDNTQRCWVLENESADPTQGTWTEKGRIFATDTDFWGIDGTVLEHNGIKYFLWSGRPVANVQNQNIYIARMSNPWTIEGNSVMLTKPDLNWETRGGPVNEGPQILKRNGKVFMIYSASGCWTDDYALGMLTLKEGGNPMVAEDWEKAPSPVFQKAPENRAYGPGHNAFFTSPDGTESWIIYHANSNSGDGCGERRTVRMQPFTWSPAGLPQFGVPVTSGLSLAVPKGE